MLLRRGIPAGDRGFTLVEVMVAVALLLIGVLGTITMVTGANAQTAVTKSREGAVNLAREVLDAARGADYFDDLTPTAIVPDLQAQPGLGDADSNTPGWQINRRGVTYTIASTPICVVDAQADGYGAHPSDAAPPFCSGQTTGTADGNPDDFRRVDTTITWSVGAHNYSLRDTTLVINPSGGIGPTVKSLCRVSSASASSCPATTLGPYTSWTSTAATLNFLALTSPADTTTWTVDDGSNPFDVSRSNVSAPTGTAWNFNWNIGASAADGTNICGSAINWTLDGNYVVTAQGVSGIGSNAVPGQLKPYTMTINRNAPYPVCGPADGGGPAGGYNNPTAPWSGHPTAVDLEWSASPERDVIGYQVLRLKGGSDSNDVLVCDTTNATSYPYVQGGCICTTQTSCLDVNPRGGGGNVTYRITALDRDPTTSQPRPTDANAQATINIDQTGTNNPPNNFASGTVGLTLQNGLPTITWPAASDPDTGDNVRWYWIYRDGTGFVSRYDRVDASRVCAAGTCSYTDESPSAGGDTYWVTAVDTHYDESSPEQAVTG